MDIWITSPSVPEQTGREEQTSRNGKVESGLGDGFSRLFLVLFGGFEVIVVLDWVDDSSDDCSDGEGELDEGGLEGAEAVAVGQAWAGFPMLNNSLLSKSLRYTGLKQE